jgi:hypothetical protein
MRIIRQVIVVGPMLWLLELFQNKLYFLSTGKWGWIYPGSPYHWFSFESLPNWCLSVVVIYIIYRVWFMPKQMNALLCIGIIGIIGVGLEYANGFAYYQVTGRYLFIWENSWFKYIDFIAIPMWWFNAAVYHLLTFKLINLHR